jgi:hypothetical protein
MPVIPWALSHINIYYSTPSIQQPALHLLNEGLYPILLEGTVYQALTAQFCTVPQSVWYQKLPPRNKLQCASSQARPHWNENPIYIFLFWELRGLRPNFNFHSHVSVSDLYISRIGPHIWLQQNRQTDPGNIKISRRYMSVGIGRQNIIILF